MMQAAGTRVGPYEILSPLGAGGMGEVYRGRDIRLDRDVAIKVLPASFANDADRLQRFEQEARATSALNHPNILTIYDIGTIPNDYAALLTEIKHRIRTAQYAALRAVNKELIALYWDIGQMIVTRQQGETWGRSIVQRLAADLHNEFPGITGFSAQNLWRMRQFYEAYADSEKLSPLVREIGWTHNVIILMQFCLAVLDDQVRLPDESPSIGIILCKSKDKTIVEYALRESNKPIGVGTYRIVTELPAELKGQLPSPEQIARLLEGIE